MGGAVPKCFLRRDKTLITANDIASKLQEIKRDDIRFQSATWRDNFLGDFVNKIKPVNIIEIGTYNGLGTVMLASIAKELVYTFDIVYRNCEFVWDLFKVRHKINNFIGTKEQIAHDINFRLRRKNIKFDFAFIDGEHNYDAVSWDFNLVKRCGKVLFHDIHDEGIGRFIKEIDAKRVSKYYGYWESK